MLVDRILYPVTTLGPGERVALWTSGCSKHCVGCANPELWSATSAQYMAPERLAALLGNLSREQGVHRLTCTGGDPLEQADELLFVLESVREVFDDVLVYTGYTLGELRALLGEAMGRLEACADVLIDGRYVAELNDGKVGLRGSTNQRVHYLNPRVRQSYERYLEQPRSIQNFVFDGRVISVGIHGEKTGRPERARRESADGGQAPAVAARTHQL
ncbi:MAG: 4Fe-4S single cluster domain-containing protein [Coriobacteriales bacterium]|nr:4Fe-4S single cluster domain-containing protein [Coriobacteriales bacterium]